MTKKEILELLEKRFIIENNQKIKKITENDRFQIKVHENDWFPKIEGLEDEFEVLKQEVKRKIKETKELEEQIKIIGKECKHEVRLQYSYGIGSSSKCICCGKKITSDNLISGNTIYNDINRNRKCVMLNAEQEIGDEFCYTVKMVYEIIKNILKDKKEDEEIDLISEFKKLNLEECQIDERDFEREYYALIIGGANKEYIDKDYYITTKRKLDSIDITHFLMEIPKLKVELIDNKEIEEKYDFKEKISNFKSSSKFRFCYYETKEDLEKIIESEKEVPFDIIIDMTEIFEYSKEPITSYQLDLKSLFPNSHIINIKNGNFKSEKEMLMLLKQQLLSYDSAYLKKENEYKGNQYYYLNDEKIEFEKEEILYEDLVKLVLKK